MAFFKVGKLPLCNFGNIPLWPTHGWHVTNMARNLIAKLPLWPVLWFENCHCGRSMVGKLPLCPVSKLVCDL